MTKEQRMAYSAGLIDGDGSLSLIRRMDPRDKNPRYYPLAQFSKSSPILSEFLKKEFGGNLLTVDRGGRFLKEYKWRLAKKDIIVQFLKSILPFLRGKDAQASILIDFVKNNPFIRGKRLDGKILESREKVHLEMKKLNSRRDVKSKLSNSRFFALDDGCFWPYIAGLMDTDGSFSIKRERNKSYSPVILLSLVNSKSMNFIEKNCRIGSFFVVKRKTENLNFYYRWGIYSRESAVRLIKNIIPFLRHKKKAAEILLEFCEGFVAQAGQYLKTKKQFDFREDCYQKLIAQNKYGVSKPSLIDLKLSAGKAGDNKAEPSVKSGTVNEVSEKALHEE